MNKKTTILKALLANLKMRQMLVFGCLIFGTGAMAQTTFYIKPEATGTGDGTSWENAGADIQLAINTAVAGDQIWVAAGTYKPNREANALDIILEADPDNAFVLKEGVALYGNFAGTEATLQERDLTILTNASILSGDFLGDDQVMETAVDFSIINNTENAYHVVLSVGGTDAPITAATVLDGFTITNGNSSTSFGTLTVNGVAVGKFTGGGMANYNASSPTIANILFVANAASYGGAIYNRNSSPLISNSTIAVNLAEFGGGITNAFSAAPIFTNVIVIDNQATAGGGVYNYESAAPVFNNGGIFQNHTSLGSGGGVFNNNAAPVFTNVSISENTAVGNGGGMFSTVNAAVILNGLTIANNSAVNGGGLYNDNQSNTALNDVILMGNEASDNGGGIYNFNSAPVLTDVEVKQNSAANFGGGIVNWSAANAQLTNVTINNNTATGGAGIFNNLNSAAVLTNSLVKDNNATGNGGGIYNREGSSPIITNVVITGNTAVSGGGIYSLTDCMPILTNVTITQNTATSQGGGLSNNNSSPILRNSILYNNTDTAGVNVFNFNESTTFYYYSLVQFSAAFGWDALGFDGGNNIDADPLFLGQSFTFQEDSPAINAGSNTVFAAEQTPDLSAITTDLAGNDRIYDDVIDLGAFEYQGVLNRPDVKAVSITYYPNPVTNQLNIQAVAAISKVSVYNMLGQEVITEDWNTNTGVLNMAQLKAGNYIVKVTAGKTVTNSIIVKQ
ncbi:beta strand repeat-containing protein [Flavobacterium subsaxonicum]|uniref:Secretion system C-terminal sorting domain-containing protein n=1 Tax=Flavobacterium subsaxonicum WB 4.1-42 = DSM 21790 TaxID=1121898 RepID=A0A0A2MX05_9FLAO|nr:T9SS type A sorting domain-containing protein [Flavobacterium subsaxonicum]KGO92740.1 hypothetical protein Q766_11530 [Flavobacterium subsaxonicum WB 4.1-42 = DSM 21790]